MTACYLGPQQAVMGSLLPITDPRTCTVIGVTTLKLKPNLKLLELTLYKNISIWIVHLYSFIETEWASSFVQGALTWSLSQGNSRS